MTMSYKIVAVQLRNYLSLGRSCLNTRVFVLGRDSDMGVLWLQLHVITHIVIGLYSSAVICLGRSCLNGGREGWRTETPGQKQNVSPNT